MAKKKTAKKQDPKTTLFEVAWEVCNQVGGIYTVVRSKAASIKEKWGENYNLIGPYLSDEVFNEFEQLDPPDSFVGEAILKMKESGFEVYYGRWLIAGRPRAILINPYSIYKDLSNIRYFLWNNHEIPIPTEDELINKVMAFGQLIAVFFQFIEESKNENDNITTHFHEWMSGIAIPLMRRNNTNTNIIFTTHATMLGRYLAMNDSNFYNKLPYYDWKKEAKKYNIEPQAHIERAAAHGANILSTVSDITANECSSLLGRTPDMILPNGLNIEKFSTAHEFQNLHNEYRKKIHQFTMGHFFPSYSFDLDKTIYFFTSGRFEYINKGFDLTLEALAQLNWKMQAENIDKTVVMYIVTKRPYHHINPKVIQSQVLLDKIDNTCEVIQSHIGDNLFLQATSGNDSQIPDLNQFVPEYWRLRLRRTLQSWRTNELPTVVTHNLIDSEKDEILNFLHNSNLINNAHDKVKIIYHPDFINPTSPINRLEYDQFVRGCNLGIFPSYYEPWGYTPPECLAMGIPSITSNLSGFGDYIQKNIQDSEENGIYVIDRSSQMFHQSANQLSNMLLSFVKQTRGERIRQRYRAENLASEFDWSHLSEYYNRTYDLLDNY